MTTTEQAARWLADVPRYTPPYTNGNWITEADALAAIARLIAPGDDLVAQAHEYAAMMRQDWDDWRSDEIADCKASTADVLDAAAACISALTAQVEDARECLKGADARSLELGKKLQDSNGENTTLRDRLARVEVALWGMLKYTADVNPAQGDESTDHPAVKAARAAFTDGGSNG